MLQEGDAKRVTIYFDDGEKYEGRALHKVLLELLREHEISGATFIRGVGGFGHDGIIHSAKLLTLTESLPLKIEFIETPEKVDKVLPALKKVVVHGLIDVSDTVIVHVS
jgi:PII-like signaling protein